MTYPGTNTLAALAAFSAASRSCSRLFSTSKLLIVAAASPAAAVAAAVAACSAISRSCRRLISSCRLLAVSAASASALMAAACSTASMATVCSAAALSRAAAPAAAFSAAALATVCAAVVPMLSCSSFSSALMRAMTSTLSHIAFRDHMARRGDFQNRARNTRSTKERFRSMVPLKPVHF
jgi:hypothetical protein